MGGKVAHCQEETHLRAIFRVMRCAGAGDKFRTHPTYLPWRCWNQVTENALADLKPLRTGLSTLRTHLCCE